MAAKPWVIHVQTIDGEQTTLQQQGDIYHIPVAELVEAACNKIGLPNHEEFTFTLNKQTQSALYDKLKRRKVPLLRASKTKLYTNDELGLLNPKKSLKQQGIKKAEALTLTLRKRLFFTETINCCHNTKERNLTYLQLQNAIITGIYSCTCDRAIELAALQCYIEYGNFNIDEDFLNHKLNSLLPCKYAKIQGITATILETYRLTSLELRESDNAKSEYIRLCTTLDRYGITFFSGKEKSQPTKKQLAECCLGITHDFVWRFEAKSCEVLEKWPIVNIQRWSRSRENVLVTLKLNNGKSYSFSPSGECDTVLQLLNDYAAIKNRYREVSMEPQSGRNSNSPVSRAIITGENLTVDETGSNPSLSHPLDSQTHVSVAGSIVISLGESTTNPTTEDPSISREVAPLDFMPGEANTLSVSVAISRGDSTVNPVNSGETDSEVRDTCVSSKGQRSKRDTPVGSEEDSPIRDAQDRHLTIDKLKIVQNKTWKARSRWQNIGIQLDLEKTDLDAINSTHGSDTDACFIEMLSLWLKQTKSLPTWSKMIRALKRPTVGFQHLAEKIEMKLNIVDKKRIEQFQFPFINEIAPNEESRKELEGRLRAQTKDIILEFNILIQQLFDTLEDQILIQNYSVQRLARYLRTYGAVNLESIDDVQSFIAERSSFFDYEILRYIIRLAGAERDKRNLQEYENHFKVYARRRVYECPSMISGASSENSDSQSSKLCIKLDSEYDKYTLNELKEFQYRLCNILNLPVCMLISIERGCLRLTFAIIHSEASFPLCKKQKARLIELGVLQLEYKEYTYSFQPNIEHKLLSRIRLILLASQRTHQNTGESDAMPYKTRLQFINSPNSCNNYQYGVDILT